MNNELTIRISGEAGQGMQTIGQALSLIYKNTGFSVFANQDYMSRIRGGNNFFQLRIAGNPLYTLRRNADIMVALDAASVALHKAFLADTGLMVLDKASSRVEEEDQRFFDVPMKELAAGTGGSDMFINSVACGVMAALTGVAFAGVEAVLRQVFSGKPEDIISRNIDAARAGFDFVEKKGKAGVSRITEPPDAAGAAGRLLLTAHDAVVMGAIRAGCKFYSAYPMTPSTGIMDGLAHYAARYNIIVEQAEDEIAAVNMALGASFAGVRAMTGTSGGGFCLMVEGISLAGMTETPVVIVDAQRPAPATGFPTRTEQADLDFVIHAGHGEFARAVYAPGTIEEAFYLTVRAFNIAEKYQIPVFLMTDQHLADSYRDIAPFDTGKAKVERSIISREESKGISGYKRYRLTDSGISPRAIPSWIDGPVYVDSDEHTEEGHITEDAGVRKAMVEKRFHKKMAELKKEIVQPTAVNTQGADIVLVGFGSTYGVLREAAETGMSGKIGFVHLSQVWPFPERDIGALLGTAKKIITVENNAAGQLARLLRRETGIQAQGSILRYDGRPFDLEYVIERLKEV